MNLNQSNPLIGIILVAQSQLGGAQLCFRYPIANSSYACLSESILKTKDEFSLPTKSALPIVIKRSHYEPFQLECGTLANLLCPTSSLCNQPFELIVDKTMFISYPSLFGKQATEGSLVASNPTDRRAASLSTFNFVLVIERKLSMNPSLVKMCSSIVKQLATVSQYEENKCGFLRTEIVRLLQARENWSNKKTNKTELDTSQLLHDLLQVSSLARCMKQIYEDLNEKGTSNCRINDWPILSLSLFDPEKHPKKPIRPYQTLLLYDGVEKFLESLPQDSSLSIRTLVQSANPVKCFSMLQTETGIPLPQIYRIVSHLLYWKKAKIIDKLTKLNTYVLNPKKNMDCFLSLEEKFNLEFSNTSFREVNFRDMLDVFSVPRKLGENIERIAQGKSQLRIQFVEAVTWFLRHNLLKPVHTYIFLVLPTGDGASTLTLPPPSNSVLSSSLSSSGHSPCSSSTTILQRPSQNTIFQTTQSLTPQQSVSQSPSGPSPTSPSALSRRPLLRHSLNKNLLFKLEGNYALTPTPLTPEEEMEISKFDDDSPTFKLFKKLCPYFKGNHHFEEIMWRENINRETLENIISSYEEILIEAQF